MTLRRAVALLLVGLMLGVVFSGAVSFGLVSATTSTGNDEYSQFWTILEKEASLVVAVNSSASSGNLNVTAVKDLIKNSRAGEANAAAISAQIWLALQELKKSGVKLHYSAAELRRMALEIKNKGLPPQTVKELKAQGWTDEEIRELREYIAKNADNIKSDFDMEVFLTNFSRAFVLVGFWL